MVLQSASLKVGETKMATRGQLDCSDKVGGKGREGKDEGEEKGSAMKPHSRLPLIIHLEMNTCYKEIWGK